MPANAVTSPLFGVWGEKWNPADRLTDWSPAGYGGGSRPIPDHPNGFNVRDYGAQAIAGIGALLAVLKVQTGCWAALLAHGCRAGHACNLSQYVAGAALGGTFPCALGCAHVAPHAVCSCAFVSCIGVATTAPYL